MIHAREDYQKRWPTDPALADPSLLEKGSTPIGENEPVCLFRAQDKHFVAVLADYKMRVWNDARDGTDEEIAAAKAIIRSVVAQQEYAEKWQKVYGCKTPDLPE